VSEFSVDSEKIAYIARQFQLKEAHIELVYKLFSEVIGKVKNQYLAHVIRCMESYIRQKTGNPNVSDKTGFIKRTLQNSTIIHGKNSFKPLSIYRKKQPRTTPGLWPEISQSVRGYLLCPLLENIVWRPWVFNIESHHKNASLNESDIMGPVSATTSMKKPVNIQFYQRQPSLLRR
jgi:hypothetical protein